MFMLSKDAKISSAVTPTEGAAAATDLEGSILDMAAHDSVLMLVRMGAITTNAVTSLRVRQSDDSAMGTPEDITGSAQTIADNADEKTFYVDLHRPTKRYVQLYIDRATQNAVISSAHYIQYNSRSGPVSAHGTNVSGETFVAPIGGTA